MLVYCRLSRQIFSSHFTHEIGDWVVWRRQTGEIAMVSIDWILLKSIYNKKLQDGCRNIGPFLKARHEMRWQGESSRDKIRSLVRPDLDGRHEMIYFDNNATTPVIPEVRDAMAPFLTDQCGNPNSIHQEGTRARAAIEKSRGSIARHIGARPSEIIFTGSGTESNNAALIGVMIPLIPNGGNLVISSLEHASVRATGQWLADRFGFDLRIAPFHIEDGVVDPQPFIDFIDENTRLVSVMAANNETGVIMPIKAIFAAARAAGALCHADGVQALGKLPVDVKDMGVDLLSFSAHKIHGPKGCGALYIRRGLKLDSLVHGGAQENGRRAGTESVFNIVGLGEALNRAIDAGTLGVEAVRDYFETRLEELGDQAVVNFKKLARTPNVSSVCFKGCDANVLVIKLDRKGFCVSTGSACNSGALSASKGLLASGLSEADAAATIRFSFSKLNTREEVDQLMEALVTVLPKPMR